MLESRRRSYAFSISTDEPKAESPVPEEGEIDEGEDSSQPEFSRRIAELKNSQKRTVRVIAFFESVRRTWCMDAFLTAHTGINRCSCIRE